VKYVCSAVLLPRISYYYLFLPYENKGDVESIQSHYQKMMKYKLGLHSSFPNLYLDFPFGSYEDGVGSFNVQVDINRVAMIHRLSHSKLQSIRTCASHLMEVPERGHPPFCFPSSFTNVSLSLTDGDENALHFWRSLEVNDLSIIGHPPSIYSRILGNGVKVVVMMDGGWVCSTFSPPDFQNMSQHRKMIFSLFVSVGISIRMGIFCQIYTKYKSLINILSSHP